MPVPFEAFLPYAIMVTMFGITGAGLGALKRYQNEGKNPRYSLDHWDKYDPNSMGYYDMNAYESSDEPRPPIDRYPKRAIRSTLRASRLRTEQPLEVGKALHVKTPLITHTRAVMMGFEDISVHQNSASSPEPEINQLSGGNLQQTTQPSIFTHRSEPSGAF